MDDSQLLRYSRQILLKHFDIQGQEKLQAARVLILGLGGLGSPASLYLAAAGIGTLVLVDHDKVDLSNLQRQIIHNMNSLNTPKVQSAYQAIYNINPECQIISYDHLLNEQTLQQEIQQANVVLDCTDNFKSRFLINKLCIENKIPLVSGAAIEWEGQLSVFDSRIAHSPCYQCLYQDEDQDEARNCSTTGILGPVVGTIGTLQALEAIKIITQIGKTLIGEVLRFDSLYHKWYSIKLFKDPACKICKSY